ncbi:hypothetical protein BOX15_Mlig018785g1 [Macrostomum lignano]|uniref:FERM domain-containing protein n=1 Tax=Macrostomum lignano TaxID=282301 RepID=A0A267DU02_9PLAT|nr:hypothetical protein BOX15_Mlig018785g1 [Macrostomum lignano]
MDDTDHGGMSDGETTQGSMNLASLDNSRQYQHQQSQPLAAQQSATLPMDYSEANTMSKKDYYTLRDKGMSLHQAAAASPQISGTMARHGSASAGGIIGTPGSSLPPSKQNTPAGKLRPCQVVMLDGSVHSFDVDTNAKAQELFDETCITLGLHEKEYFGLCYRDSNNIFYWLNGEKKLGKQIGKNEWKLDFMVKFYPPDPENLRENLTRYYMALQIRQNLMADALPCSFITYIILGSYVVQSEIGDFEPSDEKMTSLLYLQDCPFCPEEFRSHRELMERVSELHKTHQGMTPEEADMHFLQNAKKLAMYGLDMHEAKDSMGEEVFVGVYHSGVLVYRNSLRIGRYSWPKILKVSYKRNTLKIGIRTESERDSKAETVVEFKCASAKLAKRLWRAVVEHHGFFRLKSPEKPSKPLIPGTFKNKWNYTGPTRDQLNDQTYGNYQEMPVTSDMRKSFRQKEDAYNRELRAAAANGSRGNIYGGAGDGTISDVTLWRQQQMQMQQQQQRDQMDRRPELVVERPSRWHMSPADAEPMLSASLDSGRSVGACPVGAPDWQGCRTDRGVCNGGQWYYEATVTMATPAGDQPVPARVGWSTSSASLRLGDDAHGFGYGANGEKYNRGVAEAYGDRLASGDVVGVFVDLDGGSVLYSVNGKELGLAYELPHDMRREVFYPAACLAPGAAAHWNFGDDPARPLLYRPAGVWRPVGLAPANQQAENPRAWRLNQHDTSGPGLTLGPDGASAQSQLGFGWQGVRANKGLRGRAGGRFYYEVEPQEARGLSRAGWTTESGGLDIGRDAAGWGYGADPDGFGLAGNQGKKMHSDEIDSYGEPFGKGDVVGCFLDLDHGQMQFARNSALMGPAYQLPSQVLSQEAFYPTVSMRDQTLFVNLGQTPFKYPPGDEWTPVCLASEDSVRRSGKTGVMDRKSKGFTYVDPRMLQESLTKRNSNLPSVDHKYDVIRENKQQIHAGQLHGGYNGGGGGTAVHEHRTESEQVGDPVEEVETYTDEHGNKVTKRIVKRKQVRQVVTSKVVETHGSHGPPCYDEHPTDEIEPAGAAGTERREKSLNGAPMPSVRKTESKAAARRNLIVSEEGEDDDLLNDIIYQQTGFSKEDKILDDNVNDFSMSTIDNRKKGNKHHESDI